MKEGLETSLVNLAGILQHEQDLARQALKDGKSKHAWEILRSILTQLVLPPVDSEKDTLTVSTTLKFSNLCFSIGQGFNELPEYLQNAHNAADRLGDKRSLSLINLHLGRSYFLLNRWEEAMDCFVKGKKEVENLGDEDIISQAAESIGTHYFFQGKFSKAMPYLESSAQDFESDKQDMIASSLIWLPCCAAFTGQFHNAIGIADYYRRIALQRSRVNLAATLQAILGIILLLIRKNKDAIYHLSAALQEALETENTLAICLAKGGFAHHHFLEGRIEDARDWLTQCLEASKAAGLFIHYFSSLFYEIAFEMHSKGLTVPRLDFKKVLRNALLGPNVHIQGIALRLRATDAMANGEENSVIESNLELSERYLIMSGDQIQLAKTRIMMARHKLQAGDEKNARIMAQNAWKGFSGYGDIFFPNDLHFLLPSEKKFSPAHKTWEQFPETLMEILEGMTPSPDPKKILTRTLAAANRFLGAERGGVFWFRRRSDPLPELFASSNLIPSDVTTEEFRPVLSLILKAYRKNKIQRVNNQDGHKWPRNVKAILCIPFEIEGKVRGVFYHDNAYVKACFDDFDDSILVVISKTLTKYVEHLILFTKRLGRNRSVHAPRFDQTLSPVIITESPIMHNILEQVDRIAATLSNVLILGETGVGKELIAHRLHHMSQRRINPLVIINPTTIPENLLESELFGHEKGAFTGADLQKIGHIELADKGTLFIDEIGEISKSAQVKLLRVLQDGILLRVGGTKPVHSDFRFVAATNRDLAAEVAAGNFREDLFYRINVVPLHIPPLRERKEDIPLLARHFFQKHSRKYGFHEISRLTPEDEAKLKDHSWPGNVRELENTIERAVVISSGNAIELHMPMEGTSDKSNPFSDLPTMEELQRRYIRHVISKAGGKIGGKGGAADILGMKRTSLNSRIKKLGLR